MLADTLEVDASGTGTRVRWTRVEYTGGDSFDHRTVTTLRVSVRGAELRVAEHVICTLNHAVESCTDLWDARARSEGERLIIGPRIYARIATAP